MYYSLLDNKDRPVMKILTTMRTLCILALVLLNISCDQVSKNVVRKTIKADERIEVIDDNFVLTKVENNGAAYSLGSDLAPALKIVFLQIIPFIVLLYILRLILIKTNYPKTTIIGFTYIIGGGISNLYDRIIHGSVTDFMIMDLGILKTEIFNMADVSIMLGFLTLLCTTLLTKKGIF